MSRLQRRKKSYHDRVYGKYCIKAVLAMVDPNQNDKDDLEGICTFTNAYKEQRHVMLHQKFDYYVDPNDHVVLPMCTKKNSLKEALTMLDNLVMASKLREENNEARKQFLELRSNHKI